MAEGFINAQTPPGIRPAITVLRPDAAQLSEMTRTLGYGYVFDQEEGRVAHSAARYFLAANGDVTTVLPVFDASVDALRDAIVGARYGTGATATRLILLRYDFDLVTGRYSLAIWRVLTILSVLTMLMMGTGLGIAFWREGRRT